VFIDLESVQNSLYVSVLVLVASFHSSHSASYVHKWSLTSRGCRFSDQLDFRSNRILPSVVPTAEKA
jgi:hypothetical protein